MKKIIPILITLLALTAVSCKKTTLQHTEYDNIIYEVNPVHLYESSSDKTKQKTAEEFISLLYTDLFNQTVSGDDLNRLSTLILSIGDKGLANQMILENMLNASNVDIPTTLEMQSNVDQFIDDAYVRFFLRHPTEYEKYYFKNLIANDPNIKPEMIYAAFVQSNEYLFY